MKKISFLLLLFAVVTTHAQKKTTFSILLDYHTSFLPTTSINFNTIEHSEASRTPDTITLNKRLFNSTVNASYTAKPRLAVGARVSHKLNKTITITGGIGVSTFSAIRSNTISYKLVTTQQVKGPYTYNPPNSFLLYTINFQLEKTGYEGFANYYSEAKEEKIEFMTIQLPLGILISPNKSKFSSGIEIIPTTISKYKVTPYPSKGREGNQLNAYSKENRFNISARISFGYQINKCLSSSIYYEQYFHSLTQGEANPELTPKTVGVTLIAKLPTFK
ncbi:hypothetical protein [Ferruginibacter sp.]|nr:hypothetical protein [Ferruginibacter sp.]